jgi:hypothetical protein
VSGSAFCFSFFLFLSERTKGPTRRCATRSTSRSNCCLLVPAYPDSRAPRPTRQGRPQPLGGVVSRGPPSVPLQPVLLLCIVAPHYLFAQSGPTRGWSKNAIGIATKRKYKKKQRQGPTKTRSFALSSRPPLFAHSTIKVPPNPAFAVPTFPCSGWVSPLFANFANFAGRGSAIRKKDYLAAKLLRLVNYRLCGLQ